MRIMNLSIFILLLVLITGCQSIPDAKVLASQDEQDSVASETEEELEIIDYKPPEILAPSFDQREWKLVNRKAIEWRVINEFLVDGEQPGGWTESMGTTFASYQAGTSLEYELERLQQGTQTLCPDVQWKIISQNLDEIIYEWYVNDCAVEEDQHEIGRYIATRHGIHRIAYVSKVKRLSDDEKKKWQSLIMDARVVDNK